MTGGGEDPLERLDRSFRALVPGPIAPGAVVLLSRGGEVVCHRAYGWAQTHDERGPFDDPRPMTPTTVFDVASVTKLFTTGAIMRLEEEGELALDTPADRFLPALRTAPGRVTIDALLTHRGGLAAWQPVYLHTDDREEALTWVCRHGVRHPPGRRRRYSDLGFLLLGGVVERVTGERLDRFCAREMLGPLGLTSTGFRPPSRSRARIAATSTGNATERRMIATDDPEPVGADPDDHPRWRTHTLVGEAQDGNAAYAFGGIAGSAGIFSTAADLARFGHAVADSLRDGAGIWRRSTVERFLREPADRGQGRGWWTRRVSPHERPGGVGHAGFTGCEVAVLPRAAAVAVLLTNRLHTERDPPPDHAPLWERVLRAFRACVTSPPAPGPGGGPVG